jgi:hypothetical protein
MFVGNLLFNNTVIINSRWNCRFKNCEATKQYFESIFHILKQKLKIKLIERDVNEAIGTII